MGAMSGLKASGSRLNPYHPVRSAAFATRPSNAGTLHPCHDKGVCPCLTRRLFGLEAWSDSRFGMAWQTKTLYQAGDKIPE